MKTVMWIAVFLAVYYALKLNECEETQTTQSPSTQESVPGEDPTDATNNYMYLMANIDPAQTHSG